MSHDIINVTIFEPDQSIFKGAKNDKAQCNIWTCSKRDVCGYYKAGSCLNVVAIGGCCPYGRRSVTEGFTKRARNYRAWISEKKVTYKDYLWAMKPAPSKIGKVGDEFVLPYSFMAMNESLPFRAHSGFLQNGIPFIHEDALTPAAIDSICKFRPYAMMGGEIKDYQAKSVPKFVFDLKACYPALYDAAIAEFPYISEILETYSFIGRKALLRTIDPCTIKVKDGTWDWDGSTISTKAYKPLFFPFSGEITTTVKPDNDLVIVITDNAQVSERTEFAD